MGSSHSFPVRVYYEDTDAGGIVYYANYLKFAERARTELLREKGFSHTEAGRAHGIGFAVRRCAADYRKPAVLDDLLQVETTVETVAGASLNMRQTIRRDDEILVEIDVKVVAIDGRGKPARLPNALRATLAD